MHYRIGSGIDFHQLVEGREFWLGGIRIEHSKGALGHSDADVLLHAICDAMLGAVAMGDIGLHFPNNDAAYKDIDSKILLRKTHELIKNEGYSIVNIDSTVCLEVPRLRPYIDEIKKTIASILEIRESDISVKATTTEKLGFIGREEGVMAQATVLLSGQ